jgi:hypothetical protein
MSFFPPPPGAPPPLPGVPPPPPDFYQPPLEIRVRAPRRANTVVLLSIALAFSLLVNFVAFFVIADLRSETGVQQAGQSQTDKQPQQSAQDQAENADKGDGGALKRLLPEVITSARGPHRFINHDYGDGYSFFDPCRPIYWVVNPKDEPSGAREQLELAVAEVQARTGLKFIYAGETNEPYDRARSVPNTLYPEIDSEWSPVVFWYLSRQDFGEWKKTQDYDEEVAGFARGDIELTRSDPPRLVTISGNVVVGTEYVAEMISAGLPEQVWWLFLHEIGHVVGLDHVDHPSHLMHPGGEEADWTTALGSGDIEGFARAGAEPCIPADEYPRKSDWVPYAPQ